MIVFYEDPNHPRWIWNSSFSNMADPVANVLEDQGIHFDFQILKAVV